jgi:hypothetical protein
MVLVYRYSEIRYEGLNPSVIEVIAIGAEDRAKTNGT